jgi:hypothetical protein
VGSEVLMAELFLLKDMFIILGIIIATVYVGLFL